MRSTPSQTSTYGVFPQFTGVDFLFYDSCVVDVENVEDDYDVGDVIDGAVIAMPQQVK